MKCLVLNADFIPLHLVPLSTISWQEAMCLWLQDKAVPIAYHDRTVRTPTKEYGVPSVLLLKSYKQFSKHAKWSKRNVKVRDNFKCQYCGKTFSERSLTIDHVIPRAKGGITSWVNTVAACKPCNAKKKDNHKKPLKKPIRPTYYNLAKKLLKREKLKHPEWAEYMRI